MILLNKKTSKDFDNYLIDDIGYTVDLLVEQAGCAVADSVEKFLHSNNNDLKYREINIFAGKGNNGLDAFACARILNAKKYSIKLWEVNEDDVKLKETSLQKSLCISAGIPVCNAGNFIVDSNQLIIDGIFGVSFNYNRKLNDYYTNILSKINKSSTLGGYIFSIDIPSGVDPDTGKVIEFTIRANSTITFIFPKAGIISYPGREYAGKISVSNLSIPSKIISDYVDKSTIDLKSFMTDFDFAIENIRKREIDSYKTRFGKIAFLGGSRGMAGAVCISAMGAVKSGAGLIFMTVPEEIVEICIKTIPEALISSDYSKIFDSPDVLAIGPGLNESDAKAKEIIKKAIENFPKLILDAGALNIISQDIPYFIELFKKRKDKGLPYAVLTPHHGELKRMLIGNMKENRIETALHASSIFESIVIYKGAGTVIASPDGEFYVNTTGNSALARGGSGDVLTGIIASLYADNDSAIRACSTAVFIHGLSGDITSDEFTETSSSVADIIRNLPEAFKMIEERNNKLCKITY